MNEQLYERTNRTTPNAPSLAWIRNPIASVTPPHRAPKGHKRAAQVPYITAPMAPIGGEEIFDTNDVHTPGACSDCNTPGVVSS